MKQRVIADRLRSFPSGEKTLAHEAGEGGSLFARPRWGCINGQSPAVALFQLILFNTAIAALLTVIEFGSGFWTNLVFSQCIGGTIGLVNSPLIPHMAPGWRRWLTLAVSLPVSVALGIVLAHVLLGLPLSLSLKFWQALAIGMMFAVIGSIVFLLAERIHQLDTEVRQRRLAEAAQAEAQARRETEARLKVLQAQIEPHFLFNTLANVASLIEADPVRARHLLDRLNDWLRVALARTRHEQTTLGDELAMLENWLEIMAVRFGARLRWQIEVSPALAAQVFPPMLLQPLVENAVMHGIGPKLEGGTLWIRARLDEARLHLEVSDDGAGFQDEGLRQGTGLANVRARLRALYGEAARLDVRSGTTMGTVASLALPCAC